LQDGLHFAAKQLNQIIWRFYILKKTMTQSRFC
jgi:hypothetical protein